MRKKDHFSIQRNVFWKYFISIDLILAKGKREVTSIFNFLFPQVSSVYPPPLPMRNLDEQGLSLESHLTRVIGCRVMTSFILHL